ncbi:MAG TPA: AAA family ATPase [Pyrinomonadaceae bacterium]|nr:AAA family ATPase [Pyrinomonadaceae bacterium]
MQAYQNSREHIFDVLLLLYLRLKYRVEREKAEQPQGGHNEYRGLVLSEEEIQALLQNWAGGDRAAGEGTQSQCLSEVKKLEDEIAARLNGSLEQGVRLSLHEVEKRFGLTQFDSGVLVMCLAPELDLGYERLYAYLQNDVTSKRPTIDLAFRLFCENMDERVQARARFTGQSPLFKHLLVNFNDEGNGPQSFLSRPLKLDERMVRYLLEIDAPDEAIASFSRAVRPSAALSEVLLPPEEKASLVRLFTSVVRGEGGARILVLNGPADVGKKYTAEALCGSIGRGLIVANMALLPSDGRAAAALLARLFREAQLCDAAVYLDSAAVLMAEQEPAQHIRRALMQAMETFQGVTFIGSTRPWSTSTLQEAQCIVNVEFPWPDFDARRNLWRSLIARSSSMCAMPESEIETIADKFRFTAGKIHQAAAEADHRARMRQPPSPEAVTEELYRACRSQSTTKLGELAQKIKPLYTWDDIVLSKDTLQHLREICLHVRHRRRVFTDWNFDKRIALGKGTSALFSGPSGTGKTMAAEIIANDLGLDLYKIDLSTVVSKYIGETEKNLSRIFQEAEQSNAILFFDEADALFGKRSEVKDAHDRYANIEINYLLQKKEEYEGIVIMASNFQKNIDEAFTRRLRFIIEIPFPDRNYRARIWRNIFPAETPRAKDIAFDFLAGKFEISGGNIKNIALNAAFQAAENSGVVSMKHIVRATRREFQKMGRMYVKSDFGEYYNLLEND